MISTAFKRQKSKAKKTAFALLAAMLLSIAPLPAQDNIRAKKAGSSANDEGYDVAVADAAMGKKRG